MQTITGYIIYNVACDKFLTSQLTWSVVGSEYSADPFVFENVELVKKEYDSSWKIQPVYKMKAIFSVEGGVKIIGGLEPLWEVIE